MVYRISDLQPARADSAVEGRVLVGGHSGLGAVQIVQGVLVPVMVVVVVLVDGLRLEAGNGVKLLDLRRSEARQGAEDGALDLRDLGVFHGIDEGVLRPRRVRLQLARGVLLAEGRNLCAVRLSYGQLRRLSYGQLR